MTHWKLFAAVFAAFSVLALAGCSHSQDAADGGPGPNAMDQAAAARMQTAGGPNAAQAAAAHAAAARASASGGAPQTAPK